MASLEELMSLRNSLEGSNASSDPSNPPPSSGQDDASAPTGGGTNFPPMQAFTDAVKGDQQTAQSYADRYGNPQKPEEVVDPHDPQFQTPDTDKHDLQFLPPDQQTPNPKGPPDQGVSLDQLQQLRAQADKISTMVEPALASPEVKAPSFSEWVNPNPNTDYGRQVPPEKGNAVLNSGAGMWKVVSRVLAIPSETGEDVRRFADWVGEKMGVDYKDPTPEQMDWLRKNGYNAEAFAHARPGDAYAKMEARLNQLGVYTEPEANSLAGIVGEDTAHAMITTAGLMALAPRMAAVEGPGVIKGIVRSIGDAVKNHPYLTMAQTPPAAAGGTIAAEATGNPWMALPGAFAGGMGATVAIKTLGLPVKLAQAGARALLPEAAQEALPNFILNKAPSNTGIRPNSPLRDVLSQPERATTFAQDQVAGAKTMMEDEVRKAITSVAAHDPAASQEAVTQSIRDAEVASNRIVSDYWSKVPMQARVPMGPSRIALADFAGSLKDTPSAIPTGEGGKNLIDDARTLATPIRMPNGRFAPAEPTVQRMRDFLGEVRRARLNEQASTAPNDAKIRNYNQLAAIVEKAVGDALPGDTTIQQARAVSTMHHDLFSRGNVADLLAARARGDTRFRPDQSVDMLMSRHQGLQDLMNIPSGVRGYAPPDKLTSTGHNALSSIQIDTENAIRGTFRQVADQSGMDPKTSLRWIDTHAKDIKDMAGVSSELEGVGTQLRGLIDYRSSIEKSALARFAEMDPQKAVQRVWNSANPEQNAKELITSFRADPHALEGFRAQVIDEFFSRSKMQPAKMVDMLGDPKTRRLLGAVLPPDNMNRLEKMVNVASKIGNGDENSLRAHFLPTATIMAKIFGAGAGRRLSHLAGSAGTLQGPALLSQYAKQKVTELFKGIDAKNLLAKAVQDPKWEAALLSREPRSPNDLRTTTAIAKRLVRVEQGARIVAERKLKQNNPQPEDNNGY